MANKSIIKLNLGSGNDYQEGWVNVDNDPLVKVDVVADLQKKFPFVNESVDKIKASDILEHFTKEDGEIFLKECWRVLKYEGEIVIRTHNIFQIFKQFKSDPYVLIHFLYGNTIQTGVFGAHKYAYTKESMGRLLQKIGFTIVEYKMETTNHVFVAKKVAKNQIKPLSIAVIMQTPDLGGAEKYMHSLVQEFTTVGHKITLVTNLQKYISLFEKRKINIVRLPYSLDIIGDWKGFVNSLMCLPLAIIFYVRLMNKLKKTGVDVILMSNFTEKLLVTFLSLFIKIPIVWIEYGPLQSVFSKNLFIPKILYRSLNKIPKYIIVPTENTKNGLIAHAKVSLSQLSVIPCGTRVEKNKKKLFDSKIDVKGKYVIGNISRMTRDKGQQLIIKAAPEILKEIPNAYFILIGDGPDKEYFMSLIHEKKLDNYFFLPGFVDSTDDYFYIMDIFIFPTIWDLEGFGLVIIEAMTRHIPVVGSDFGPVKEIIDDNSTGVLFEKGNAKDLANCVIRLKNNAPLHKKIAGNAYEKVMKQYDIKKVNTKILDVLYDAII